MADANIRAVITADDKASSVLEDFGKNVSKHSKVAATAILGIGIAAAGFAALSVKAFMESENAVAQTNAVLKSTAGIAGVTAGEVDKLSKALQRTTKYSDEDVRSVENLLLTFTSIGKDIFPKATAVVLDMATALGEDTKSASIQLGKALQDPILGITALRRVGVNFSDDQKKVIENLVETGKKAEAQKMILKELETEFGGSAKAAGETLAGKLVILKNQFNDVQEAIGGLIAAVATPLLSTLLDWFDKAGGVEGVMKKLQDAFNRIKDDIPAIAGAITGILLPAMVNLALASAAFLFTLGPFAIVGAGLVILWNKLGISIDGIRDAFHRVTEAVQQAWFWFKNLDIIVLIGQYVRDILWPALKAVGAAVVENLLPALSQLWESFKRLWVTLNPALLDALKVVGAILLGVFLAAVYLVIAALNIAIQTFSFLISVISNVINWFGNLIGWVGNFVSAMINGISTSVGILWNLPRAFADVVGALFYIAASIPGLIARAVGNLGGLLYGAGSDLIQGLINGILGRIGDLVGNIKSAVGSAVSAAKSVLGIHSPSKVFEEIGQNVSAGFVKGIEGSEVSVNGAMNTFMPQTTAVSPTDSVRSSAPMTVNITVQAGAFMGSQQDARQYAIKIMDAYRDAMAVRGTPA